jgi:hypothetical protein
MGRKDCRGPNRLHRLGETEIPTGHEFSDALEIEEAGVSLVRVEHRWVVAESAQRTSASDAEHDLLTKSVLAPTRVEAIGYLALLRGVVLDVAVEEEQRYAPDLRAPHLRDAPASLEVDIDLQGSTVGRGHQGERHAVGIERWVPLLLPTVRVQLLTEVALSVEKPDSDHRKPEIACSLEVVARENAETARVGRQGLADAELRREIGDGLDLRPAVLRSGRARPAMALIPAIIVEVAVESVFHRGEESQEGAVLGQLSEPLLRHDSQQPDRVVPCGLPRIGVDPPEEVERASVPRPSEVRRNGG